MSWLFVDGKSFGRQLTDGIFTPTFFVFSYSLDGVPPKRIHYLLAKVACFICSRLVDTRQRIPLPKNWEEGRGVRVVVS